MVQNNTVYKHSILSRWPEFFQRLTSTNSMPWYMKVGEGYSVALKYDGSSACMRLGYAKEASDLQKSPIGNALNHDRTKALAITQ
jgi:hypothetical protein